MDEKAHILYSWKMYKGIRGKRTLSLSLCLSVGRQAGSFEESCLDDIRAGKPAIDAYFVGCGMEKKTCPLHDICFFFHGIVRPFTCCPLCHGVGRTLKYMFGSILIPVTVDDDGMVSKGLFKKIVNIVH